jgi:predicted cupin superfamily sugar epimerase
MKFFSFCSDIFSHFELSPTAVALLLALSGRLTHDALDKRPAQKLWNFTFCAHLAVKDSRRMKNSLEGRLIARIAAPGFQFPTLKLHRQKYPLKLPQHRAETSLSPIPIQTAN